MLACRYRGSDRWPDAYEEGTSLCGKEEGRGGNQAKTAEDEDQQPDRPREDDKGHGEDEGGNDDHEEGSHDRDRRGRRKSRKKPPSQRIPENIRLKNHPDCLTGAESMA